jgi:hypothetical protein
MLRKNWRVGTAVIGAFVAGFGVHALMSPPVTAHAAANRVFEIRTYTAPPGKFDAMKARFRDHTLKLFAKHGMTNVGYFIPQDAPLSENTLMYVLAHASREEAKKSWAAFQADPDWVKAKAESEKDGRIVEKVTSVFADPADFSPLK